MELKYFVTKEEVNNLAEKWWDLDWELRGTLATTGTSGESQEVSRTPSTKMMVAIGPKGAYWGDQRMAL